MKNKLTEFRPCVGIIRSLCNESLSSDDMDNTNTAEIFKLVCMNQEEGQKIEDLKLDTFIYYKITDKDKRE